MSTNTVIFVFVLLGLIILVMAVRRSRKGRNRDDVTESETEEVPFWSIIEETANKLVLQIESTDTVFTFDLDSGIITRSESQPREMPNPVEVPISQVEKLLLTFEDAPSGIDPYAKLALITSQGERFPIVRGYRYTEVVSPMAKKIAGFIHKTIEEEILEYGTFWQNAG